MPLNVSAFSRHILPVAIAVLVAPAAALAQAPTNQPTPSIRVVAEATVNAKPDQVEIDIGVTTQAQTSREASARNAGQFSHVVKGLESALGARAAIETISYSLAPDYRYPKDGGRPSITGYTATNVVRVTLDDLNKVGDAIDASTAAGANQIHRVHFTLKDTQSVQSRALQEAATRAKAQAEALASALGLKVVGVLSVTESEPIIRPYQEATTFRADAAMPATPIQPGTIEAHATITLTVEIANR